MPDQKLSGDWEIGAGLFQFGWVWELPMKCTRFHGLRPCRCCTLSEWQGEAVTNDSLPCCPREQSLACPSNSRPKRRNTESLSPCQINRDESTQRLFEVGAHNSITKCSLRQLPARYKQHAQRYIKSYSGFTKFHIYLSVEGLEQGAAFQMQPLARRPGSSCWWPEEQPSGLTLSIIQPIT